MLTQNELDFIEYWRKNRDNEKKITRQLTAGLPIGLSVAAAILLCVFSGWYQKAMMDVSTELSPWVLILAVLLIAVLFGLFYKKQRWEQNEQTYRELLIKQKKAL